MKLEQRSLDAPALKAFLDQNLGQPLETWPTPKWDFEMLTLAAFYYQPSLAAARATWKEAQAGIQTAGARPNPSLSFTPQYVFNPEGAPPWVHTLSLDVPIETAGKRGARLAQARQISESARLNIAVTAWQVRAQLRLCVMDYVAAGNRAALLRRQADLQRQLVTALEQKRQAGALAATEVMPAWLLLQKTQVDLAEAQRQEAEARARVAEAIGVPLAALGGVEVAYNLSSLPADIGRLTSPEVRRQALTGRADVLAALADYAASQAALQLEVARQYPDIHLSTGYEYDQGQNKWAFLGLGVELPLLNRNEGPIAQAEARRQQAAARFEAVQAKVIADIDRALALYEAAGKSRASAQGLVEAQRKQQEAVEQQFKTGVLERADVLTVQVELEAARLTLADAETRIHQALGELEDALQRPRAHWPDLEHIRTGPATQEKP